MVRREAESISSRDREVLGRCWIDVVCSPSEGGPAGVLHAISLPSVVCERSSQLPALSYSSSVINVRGTCSSHSRRRLLSQVARLLVCVESKEGADGDGIAGLAKR